MKHIMPSLDDSEDCKAGRETIVTLVDVGWHWPG